MYESVLSVVPPPASDGGGGGRTTAARALARARARTLGGLAWIFECVRHIHYEAWDGPTECRQLLENGVGAPYMYWYMLGATAFLDWWLATPRARDEDYALYRQQLELLQHLERLGGADGDAAAAPPRAWLLKDPLHCFSFDALFGALPDAKVWSTARPRSRPRPCARCSRPVAHEPRHPARRCGPGAWRARGRTLSRMVDAALAYRARAPRAAVLDDDGRARRRAARDRRARRTLPAASSRRGARRDGAPRARLRARPRHKYALADWLHRRRGRRALRRVQETIRGVSRHLGEEDRRGRPCDMRE